MVNPAELLGGIRHNAQEIKDYADKLCDNASELALDFAAAQDHLKAIEDAVKQTREIIKLLIPK